MSKPMDDFMAADEKIDALPTVGVKDLYVRAKLMRAAMDKYRDYPEGWDSEGYESAEHALQNFNKDGVRAHYANSSDASPWLQKVAVNNRAEDFIVETFDRITNNDWSDEKTVSVARDYLKDHLSGSMGMPDDTVIRENLKNYDGGDA